MKRFLVQRSMMQCLGAAFLFGVFTFAWAYKPTDEAVSKMKPQDARRQVTDLLKSSFINQLTSASIVGVAITTDRIELQFERGSRKIYLFKDMPAIEVTSSLMYSAPYIVFGAGREDRVTSFNRHASERLADALHRLKIESMKSANPAIEAEFAEAAERYRAANPKPEFPEAARRYRVQAEAAVRDKEFDVAADLYAEALNLAPWWPEGRFNRALILGELKDYAEATVEMKRYLALVPDAPNARAAQDKIYEWEASGSRK
jgi:tetratricopeptide (TPR) repeat protein